MGSVVEKLNIHQLVFRNPPEEIACFTEKVIAAINVKILQAL